MATHTADTKSGGSERDGELPGHVVDSLLASPARCLLLRVLRDADEPLAVDDLAAILADATSDDGTGDADRDGDTEGGDGTPADRWQARTEIYQRHLPRLTEAGAVTFDSRLGTVAFTGGPRLTARLDEKP